MDKRIIRRFIGFNMLVIGAISIILFVFTVFGSRSELPLGRSIFLIALMLALSFAGGVLLSRIAVKPIREAWHKQLDFTADASHELRTPLAAMRTNLELVMDSPQETVESMMKWLKNIEEENLRMSRLVDDLLTLSRADAQKATLARKEISLADVAREAIEVMTPMTSEKGVHIAFEGETVPEIIADEKRVRQLVMILLDNALKYTQSGGKVTLSLSRVRNKARLVVADTGIGMSREEVNRAFDRFFRGSLSRKMNPDGSGLGLAIVKQIADEHACDMCVQSEQGRGSRFIVDFPCATSKK